MKKILPLLLITSFIISALSSLCFADGAQTEQSVLNVSEVTEEQAELCAAVMIDGFEAEEAERKADAGTLTSFSSDALEGEKCLKLSGSGSAGVTLTPSRSRNTAKTRSLCVCLYVTGVEDAGFTVTVTLVGDKKTVTGTAELPADTWCAAYLPIDTSQTLAIKDIRVSVSAVSDKTVRVNCLIDRVHTALVDGLPDRLPYFASGFTANRGEISCTDDALVLSPTGSNSSFESTACGYMTNGLYNALAIRLVNECTAEKMTVRFKLDKQVNYSDANSKTLSLLPGENVYYFNIGGFQSGTTVSSFKIELPGAAEGSIRIKSISFASYRFPAEYSGKVSAYVSGEKIIVSGTLPDFPASSERICLYRLAPGVDEELPGDIDAEPYRTSAVSGSFRFEIPKKDGDTKNAYFKYLIRYEGKNGYEDAGVSYVTNKTVSAPNIKYKGMLYGGDETLIHSLMPAAVYIDVNVTSDADGDISYVSQDALDALDKAVLRCSAEDARVVLKFNYGAFNNSDKYFFSVGDDILPDITTAEGADFYLSLLSFFAERYGGAVAAVIPCGELDSRAIASMRGLTPDRAEKYASALMISAQNVLSEYNVSVLAPVSYEGAGQFAEMLNKDISNPSYLALYVETQSADEAACAAEAVSAYGFLSVVRCPAETVEELIRLYYGCQSCVSICAALDTENGDICELFPVLDTTYGLTAADALSEDVLPGGVSSYYKNIKTPSKAYENLGSLEPASLPSAVTTLYGGENIDGWSSFDCCKSIYEDEINGEPAAGAAFDFTEASYGYATFEFETAKKYEILYLRLYTDYLPEDVTSAAVQIAVYGTGGMSVGCILLQSGETTTVSLPVGDTTGAVKRIALSFAETLSGSTPRICIPGIYTEDKNSSESVTEAEPETMLEPETQHFDTAPVTTTAAAEPRSGGGNASLYLTAICVIIAMFALCGAVILILKKKKGETK